MGEMEKFVLRSRALWGMLLPGLALIAQQTGIGEDVFGQGKTAVEGLLGAAGALMWLWHHFWPDERQPVIRVGAKVGLLGIVLCASLSLGCAVGVTKTDRAWAAHVVAGQAQISAGPECKDPEAGEDCDGILVTGGAASEGFLAAIVSPLSGILKGLLAGL